MSLNDRPEATRAVPSTAGDAYTARLLRLSTAHWKQRLDVQAPYRWNIRRLCPGQVLDVGCGIGRNLEHLGSRAIGVDHNKASVKEARARGLSAWTPDAFRSADIARYGHFDTLLLSHVLEHLMEAPADDLLRSYLPFLRPGGRVVLITPQERGWSTDDSHVRWVGEAELNATSRRLGLTVLRTFSFPFPRPIGRQFIYNEFVHISLRTPPDATWGRTTGSST